jgi:hypothetical protein
MNDITGFPIKNITAGGAADGGDKVHFSFEFEDGNVRSFLIPSRRIGIFFTIFQKLAQMAFDERVKIDPTVGQSGTTDVVDLIKIENIRTGLAIKKEQEALVLLHLDGPSKLTFELGLDVGLTRNLIESLQKEVAKIEQSDLPQIH